MHGAAGPSSGTWVLKYSPAVATVVMISAPSRIMAASTHVSPASINISLRKIDFLDVCPLL